MSAKFDIRERTDYILEACRGKRVLHVGCTDMPYTEQKLRGNYLLHADIEKVAAVQYGIDLSEEGIKMLQDAGFKNLAVGDVEEIATKNPFGDVEFDIILAGEIVEHLSNPGLFLAGIRPLLKSPDARLIITTVNATCAYRVLYTLLTNDEKVHPDHVFYYSRKTLTELVRRYNYVVENFCYYPVGREHVPYLNRKNGRLLFLADRFAKRFRTALGDGVMVTCRLETAA